MAFLVGVLPGAVPGVGVRAAEVGAGSFAMAVPQREELAPGDCAVLVDKHASPDPVVQGAALELTLSVRAVCEPAPPGLHLVLVVDSSTAAADPVGREIKDALAELVEWFDPSAEEGRLVGVVSFDDTARSVCELSGDTAQTLSCLEGLGSGGSAAPEAGLTEAMGQLTRGRDQQTESADLREIVLLVQAGPPANECTPVLQAAGSLKGQGVLVIGACAGPNCDVSCTRQSATSGRYFFSVDDWSKMEPLVVRMREDAVVPRPLALTVTETLSANMEYRAGSAVPAPDTADNGLLVWSELLYTEGFTFTFQVTPTELGRWPTSEEARALVTRRDGRPPISVVFPNPEVNVIAGNWQLFMPALPQRQ